MEAAGAAAMTTGAVPRPGPSVPGGSPSVRLKMDDRTRLDARDPAALRRLFAAVVGRYDLLNRLLSGWLDLRWRQRLAGAALPETFRRPGPAGAVGGRPLVVDVCTGTGDVVLAVLARDRRARVVGCDFSRPMLRRAREKLERAGRAARALLVEADVLTLPLPDASADAVTCAFGLRNLADEARALAEMRRVLRPGGRLAVLEFHRPRPGPWAGLFGLYFRRIVPRLGDWISTARWPGKSGLRLAARAGPAGAACPAAGTAADAPPGPVRHDGYGYLVRSIEGFGGPERLAGAMRRAGLAEVEVRPLPGGVASIYTARRP